MQDRSPPVRQNPLATHGRTIHWGQFRKPAVATAMSAFPPLAAELRTSLEVRFVPTPEVAGLFNHLIGAKQNRLGNGETGSLRGLQIDNQFEFGCLLHR
jgi:hypothetical protein